MSHEDFGRSLNATVLAVLQVIQAIHDRKLPAHPSYHLVKPEYVRWTPSVQPGSKPSADSKPYTATLLCLYLGNAKNGKPHRFVELALLLLELHERGEVTNGTLGAIFEGKTQDSARSLRKLLEKNKRPTKQNHKAATV